MARSEPDSFQGIVSVCVPFAIGSWTQFLGTAKRWSACSWTGPIGFVKQWPLGHTVIVMFAPNAKQMGFFLNSGVKWELLLDCGGVQVS